MTAATDSTRSASLSQAPDPRADHLAHAVGQGHLLQGVLCHPPTRGVLGDRPRSRRDDAGPRSRRTGCRRSRDTRHGRGPPWRHRACDRRPLPSARSRRCRRARSARCARRRAVDAAQPVFRGTDASATTHYRDTSPTRARASAARPRSGGAAAAGSPCPPTAGRRAPRRSAGLATPWPTARRLPRRAGSARCRHRSPSTAADPATCSPGPGSTGPVPNRALQHGRRAAPLVPG